MNTSQAIVSLTRLNKPIGILLLLWPTLWGLWIASQGHPPPALTCVLVLGVVLTRSAGCVLNDLTDRKLDGHVQRTQKRPLACKQLSLTTAYITLIILACCAASLLLFLNTLCFKLALVAALLTVIYPWCKRLFPCPQMVLGLAWAMAPLIAFAAYNNHLAPICLLLYGITFLWTISFDTIYALMDVTDDSKMNLHSSALFFGRQALTAVAVLQGLMGLLCLVLGLIIHGRSGYFFGLLLALTNACYQHWVIQTQPFPKNCERAFKLNHLMGGCIFLALVMHFSS